MAGTGKDISSLPKAEADRVGRMFNLLFNRVSMYHLEHPSTQETLSMFQGAIRDGLRFVSPLTVVLERDRIYVEEEPLDSRVSAQRLVTHMKKAGIQSVSFERGLSNAELSAFARVFGEGKQHPTSEAMKQGLLQHGVQKIRINHVFFKKMTADDEVVGREDALRATGGFRLGQVLIDTSSVVGGGELIPEAPAADPAAQISPEDALFRELFEDLTLVKLLEDPEEVSRRLLQTGVPVKEGESPPDARGEAVLHGIRQLRVQVENAGESLQKTGSMEALVEAVFKLREEVREGVEVRRERGDLVADDTALRREMDDLTDQVMIQLVREEYRRGQITVKRLAQILRRMIPDLRELKRLLPKLKEALLADGMPLSDYLQLIRELERELQSDELALVLEEGAEEIGLSAADLMQELRKDPKGAAELVAIASELRALGAHGDPNILTQILVDYVERVSGGLAVEEAQKAGPEGAHRIQEIVSRIQQELLSRIQGRLGSSSVVKRVQEEMQVRQERSLEELKREWILRYFLRDTQGRADPQTVLRAVESAYGDPVKQGEVLDAMVQAMEARGLDPGPLKAALAQSARMASGEADPLKAPKGTFNRNMFLFFLREEVKRANRYPYIFSALLLSVRKATAMKPIPLGLIRPHEIRNVLMTELAPLLRDVDLVGFMEDNKVAVLLPFTGKNGAQAVCRRLLEGLDQKKFTVRNIPMLVNLAVVEETFIKDRIPNLQSLMVRLEAKLSQALKP
jgi:hypothetical protein